MAFIPRTTILLDLKVAVGNATASMIAGVWMCAVSWGRVVTTLLIGNSIETTARSGWAGSSVNVPVGLPKMPLR